MTPRPTKLNRRIPSSSHSRPPPLPSLGLLFDNAALEERVAFAKWREARGLEEGVFERQMTSNMVKSISKSWAGFIQVADIIHSDWGFYNAPPHVARPAINESLDLYWASCLDVYHGQFRLQFCEAWARVHAPTLTPSRPPAAERAQRPRQCPHRRPRGVVSSSSARSPPPRSPLPERITLPRAQHATALDLECADSSYPLVSLQGLLPLFYHCNLVHLGIVIDASNNVPSSVFALPSAPAPSRSLRRLDLGNSRISLTKVAATAVFLAELVPCLTSLAELHRQAANPFPDAIPSPRSEELLWRKAVDTYSHLIYREQW
ncbi:hypothetical protein DFH07DRAFT_1060437 [Mycena maculata]|uniref:Uncharacterized protein n=1 Tax=Mycena maculata TaxID=230809 RepID=A0AAD7J6L5_9AGAR|nr:hypothetical protein DFH07DRAFT_1060437 [Mycena maculata]